MNIPWGFDRHSKESVSLPMAALDRHLHLCGFTGSGKTTAIITLLLQLFCQPYGKRCTVIIDRLGGFSLDLLRWFASGFCPPWVRKRLVYIEGAREDVTVPMHPLSHASPGEAYYRTARAAEIALRGWDSQDLLQMPRLMRWMFNSLYAVCRLGRAVADAAHLLFPRSPLHKPILACLPEALRWEWEDIIKARGSQADVQLESCRNRLKPFFDCPALRNMFSSTVSRFDVRRWMREKNIILVNLAPMGRLPEPSADTIGGMVVNEVLSVARSLAPEERQETLLVLDEFQRFVRGSDLEFALAESRQLRVSLLLSHQSFSQLKTETVDLTSLILQAQTRLMLKVAGFDAEILATELAGFTFDPMAVKDEIHHRCQRVSGHRIVDLESHSKTEQLAEQWGEQFGETWNEHSGRSTSEHENVTRRDGVTERVRGEGESTASQQSKGKGGSRNRSGGGSRSSGETHGTHQTLVPEYEEYVELSSRTFWQFEERKNEWGRKLRRLQRGQGVLQIADDEVLYEIDIQRTAPGHLAFSWESVLKQLPRVAEAYHRLLDENFRQECFVSAVAIERETEERLQRVLHPRIEIGRSDPPTALTDTHSGRVAHAHIGGNGKANGKPKTHEDDDNPLA